MYDNKSEPNEFVADSRGEAVAKASRFYGVEQSELQVKEPPVGDIFGLGARTVVVAFPKDMKPRDRSGDNDRGDRDRDRGGRDRERGGRERGRGGRSGGRSGGRDSGRRPREEAHSDEAPAPAAPAKASGPSKGTAVGDVSEFGQYVLGMVERMRLGSFELSEAEDGEFIVVELKGEAADSLNAGDNRVIGALQLLVNQAAMRADETPKRIVLDCGGQDDDQRESFLETQAGRAAKRALDTGRPVALDPMNARDRRALHVAVREIEDCVTMSMGAGRYRQVVIVPKGADEYEEALKASEEAASKEND